MIHSSSLCGLVVVIGLVGCGLAPVEPTAAEREIVRLMESAAAHATRSDACVDGSGTKVTIDDIVVAPGDGANRFAVSYRVTVDPEADTRGCAPPCTAYAPRSSEQRIEITFAGGLLGRQIVVPTGIPGVPLITPLDEAHEGDCYPDAPPFDPAAL